MIDVKELHIGAHILANDIRAKVVDINRMQLDNPDCPYRVFVEGINSHGDKQIVGGFVNYDKIQPIPLTAELLTEIGFEHIDKTPYVKHFDDSYIGLSLVGNGLWRVLEYDNVMCHGSMLCRYLHELEGFIYMTLHKELIEE